MTDWLEDYLTYTAESEAPDVFHLWTGISTIAGALRRRVWVDMGIFKWFPNFYLLFVAPPGIVSKSTTADLGMSLLRDITGIKFGPSAVTWQALITALLESREDYPMPDGTYVPMCALTIVASELGSLIQPQDTAIITALTDLWDGKEDAFRKKTKGGGDEVVLNSWLNMIGCTTPSWIAENFNEYFAGSGFASRVIFIYGEAKRHLAAYPFLRFGARRPELRISLVERLAGIANLQGECRLTPRALQWGIQWYDRHNSSDNPLRSDPNLAGYFARKQSHLHKTAMVVAVARTGQLQIDVEDLERALGYIEAVEPNMSRVFGNMSREKITEFMARVLLTVRRHGSVSKQSLYAELITTMGYLTFDECITSLLSGGLITLTQNGQNIMVNYNVKV